MQPMYCRSSERARALGHEQRWYVVSFEGECYRSRIVRWEALLSSSSKIVNSQTCRFHFAKSGARVWEQLALELSQKLSIENEVK